MKLQRDAQAFPPVMENRVRVPITHKAVGYGPRHTYHPFIR